MSLLGELRLCNAESRRASAWRSADVLRSDRFFGLEFSDSSRQLREHNSWECHGGSARGSLLLLSKKIKAGCRESAFKQPDCTRCNSGNSRNPSQAVQRTTATAG